MNILRNIFLVAFILYSCLGHSQNDSLVVSNKNPKKLLLITSLETTAFTSAMVGLNVLWYKDYPKTDFHFFNDNNEWLQMDKIGHGYSTYYISKFVNRGLVSSGYNKNSALYSSIAGFASISAIEIFDGYSENWGASYGDLIANATGSGLFLFQDLIWKEQRITPKFSFHKSEFAQYRPNVLGSNFQERLLKDYNGQTFWLSVNLASFTNDRIKPRWLNVAIGYSADGMISGEEYHYYSGIQPAYLPSFERKRQFYLSLDVDFTKIKTKSKLLKSVFEVINILKVPFPTLEYSNNNFRFIPLYL